MKSLNRRRVIRHRTLLPVKVSIPETDIWVESKVFNCHRNGVCFSSDIPCSPGENLDILIPFETNKIHAKVVWCHPATDIPDSKKVYKMGVKYSL